MLEKWKHILIKSENIKNKIKYKIIVKWIKWDKDYEEDKSILPLNTVIKIPNNIDVENEDEILDFIENALSNKYWYTHNWWENHEIKIL